MAETFARQCKSTRLAATLWETAQIRQDGVARFIYGLIVLIMQEADVHDKRGPDAW